MKSARKMRGDGLSALLMALVFMAVTGTVVGYFLGFHDGIHQSHTDTLATQSDGEVRWIERGK